MARSMIELVALALFASDGMKYASGDLSLEQSWAMNSQMHDQYHERALVFIKVMGMQMAKTADTEIAGLDLKKGL